MRAGGKKGEMKVAEQEKREDWKNLERKNDEGKQ